jgi:hypothetical protein
MPYLLHTLGMVQRLAFDDMSYSQGRQVSNKWCDEGGTEAMCSKINL